MSKIFITGVAGFLGGHLADKMLADGHEVVGIDNMLGGEPDNVNPEVEFHHVDCNEFERMKAVLKGCEIVFHCAATAYEGLSVFSPHVVTQNVVSASVATFSAAIANGVKRIVTCSSMARYGAGASPFHEIDIPVPEDPYGIGKLTTEHFLKNLCDTHGVEYAIAVPHNIIGPREKYDDPYRNVASIMANLMLQGRRPVIYGDGEQRRCFSYVDDCIYCLKEMAFRPEAVGHIINIGPDEDSVSINELYQRIANQTGFNGAPVYMADRPKEVKFATCSADKARALLDYRTTVGLDDGLAAMIDYIRERGTRPFKYHLDLEIITDKTPKTWLNRLF